MTLSRLLVATTLVFAACSCQNNLQMYIGTYTGAGSEGIYVGKFNQNTGRITVQDSICAVNPSFLALSDDGRWIYAVNETSDDAAAVETFDRKTLKSVGKQLTYGEDPCYVAAGKGLLVTANYTGGSLSVFPLENGLPATCSQQFAGSVRPEAQDPDALGDADPHVHCAVFSPNGKHVLVSDFGGDRILIFRVASSSKSSCHACPGNCASPCNSIAGLLPCGSCAVRPFTGPRHITFDPSGRHVYVIGELSGEVTVFDWYPGVSTDPTRPCTLTPVQTVQADMANAHGSADIHISPDGRFLYASNRLKDDGIAIFAISDGTSLAEGLLTPVGYCLTGTHPRNFCISPNGKYLICTCRDSGTVEVYRRSSKTGLLTPVKAKPLRLSKPVFVKVSE